MNQPKFNIKVERSSHNTCRFLAILAVILFTFTSCAATVPDYSAESLTVCVGTKGRTADPAFLDETPPAYLSHLHEGLMKYAPASTAATMNEAHLTYGLAECVEIDGCTYRFTLRQNALWSDGVPITAHDFVYAWNRLLTANSSGAKQLRRILQSVTAESDGTLVAVLRQSCPWFLKLCAEVYLAPLRQDLIETNGMAWTDAANLVSSGAYALDSVHSDHITLRCNPYYYDALSIKTECINWYFTDSISRPSCDFAAEVPAEAASGQVRNAGTYFLYLNINAIGDWRVRAAMTLAIDRDALAQAVGAGAAPATGLVPSGISATDGGASTPDSASMLHWLSVQYPNYDLNRYAERCLLAQELYAQAIYAGKWNTGTSLRYLTTPTETDQAVAAQCLKNWREVLNLKIQTVELTPEAYTAKLNSNTFDVAYTSRTAEYDDPMSFLQIMNRGGADNHSGWGDVRYRDMLTRAEQTREAAARDDVMRQAEQFLFESDRFVLCPLFWHGETYHADSGLIGIAHSGTGGYFFGYAHT